MSFNDNITLDTSNVRSGGRGGTAVGGIGALGIVGAIVYFLLTGQAPPLDTLTGINEPTNVNEDNSSAFEECQTGADANSSDTCRMIAGANSLDTFWADELPSATGIGYAPPTLVLYSHTTPTACGTGSSQMGPFYCPGDSSIYIDTTFFAQLRQLGAENSSLAQLYILAHEWGHHIQSITGILSQVDPRSSGPTSSMVRSELQADCLAGVWINNASSTIDSDTGTAFMQHPTQAQITSALAAAEAVGDDRLYENAGMRANPDNFSHGSSEKRLAWLTRGLESGTINVCDTWSIQEP